MCKKLRLLIIMMILVMTGVVFTGCSKDKGGSVEENIDVDANLDVNIPQVNESDLEANIEQEDSNKNENLLTGLSNLSEEAIGKRPVAVMINNIAAALPQYGISAADLIFEIPVEGSQTRLMALYADYTQVPKICAVRSCRDYFPAFSKGFDAFYVHWGQDNTIKSYLEGLDLDRFNGLENTAGLFGRDNERKNSGYSLEHTGYFDGTGLVDAIEELGMRTELLEDKKTTAFRFCDEDTVVIPVGEQCDEVYVDFGAQSSTFVYDAENKIYLKLHNGNEHVDGVTGDQLSFENVLVLETTIYTRDSKGHKSVDWKGSSDAVGYYISNGVVQEINWSKADEASFLMLYDVEGNELVINRGKTFIAVCTSGQAEFTCSNE